MIQTPSLSGQSVLITGGAGGIGLATARALAEAGAEVSLTTRSAESRAQALAALAGLKIRAEICDITDRGRLAEVMAAGFDILINNAAQIAPIGRITEVATADFAAAIDTNLIAQFDAIRLALPKMLTQRSGTVINISSGAAHRPQEGWGAYCCSKAGLAMLTQCLHHEYGGSGIRVFGFAPGVVDTGMQGQIRASGINPVSQIPRATLAPPTDPATAIRFLCSAAADPLLGRELDIRDPALRAAAGLPPLG